MTTDHSGAPTRMALTIYASAAGRNGTVGFATNAETGQDVYIPARIMTTQDWDFDSVNLRFDAYVRRPPIEGQLPIVSQVLDVLPPGAAD